MVLRMFPTPCALSLCHALTQISVKNVSEPGPGSFRLDSVLRPRNSFYNIELTPVAPPLECTTGELGTPDGRHSFATK